MCALAALANLGKADIISAQELPNGRIIVNNDPNAALGSGEKQVKIPWMIVSPDGRSGFANDFTTNAISLVSEDIRYDMIPMPSTSGSGIQSFEIVKQTKESIEEKGAEIVRHPIDPKFRSTSNSITSSNTDVSTQESIDDDDDDYLQGTTTQQYKKQQQKSKRQQKQQQKQKSQKRK